MYKKEKEKKGEKKRIFCPTMQPLLICSLSKSGVLEPSPLSFWAQL